MSQTFLVILLFIFCGILILLTQPTSVYSFTLNILALVNVPSKRTLSQKEDFTKDVFDICIILTITIFTNPGLCLGDIKPDCLRCQQDSLFKSDIQGSAFLVGIIWRQDPAPSIRSAISVSTCKCFKKVIHQTLQNKTEDSRRFKVNLTTNN